MSGHIFGEFFGTLVLIAFGDGVVANLLLQKNVGTGAGSLYGQTAWGFAVLFGIITSVAVGGVAHLNPAVTLAVAVATGDYSNVIPFAIAQFAGAFCGAVLVWLVYLPHWAVTDNPGAKRGIFCTGPGVRNLPLNALTEFLATTILVTVGMCIGHGGTAGLAPGMGPFLWGVLIWAIGMSFGGPTGYAMTPARDLAPRIAHAILPIEGKGDSDWGYALVPVIAPLAGGVVGALISKAIGTL